MTPTDPPSRSTASVAGASQTAGANSLAASVVALASLPPSPQSYQSPTSSHPAPTAAPSSSPAQRVRSRNGFTRPFAPLQIGAWVLMSICVIIYFSLCIPFVPDGHDAEFYSFVFIYIGIFLSGLAAYIMSDIVATYTSFARPIRSQPRSPTSAS